MAQAHRTPQPRAAPSQPRAFKLVLLGSGSVGKSSLALRYVKNDFKNILPTVGCAFFTKVVDVGTASLKLEIWDTAGQEKYHSVCHLYFRGANAALLVYDITRKDSFLKAQQWLKDLEKELHPEEVLVMLVGNKTDLSEEREVTFQDEDHINSCRQVADGETPHILEAGPGEDPTQGLDRQARLPKRKGPSFNGGCGEMEKWGEDFGESQGRARGAKGDSIGLGLRCKVGWGRRGSWQQ
uniref:Ras-related protein Rab-17 n=2 Tax=Macaca mulatta TaxID=9544 RepID=F7HB42_MACMU